MKAPPVLVFAIFSMLPPRRPYCAQLLRRAVDNQVGCAGFAMRVNAKSKSRHDCFVLNRTLYTGGQTWKLFTGTRASSPD